LFFILFHLSLFFFYYLAPIQEHSLSFSSYAFLSFDPNPKRSFSASIQQTLNPM